MTAITTEQLAAWNALADAATPGPWLYRSKEFDDWGFVRAARTGRLALIGRAGDDDTDHAAHRAAGTDPYGPNAKFAAAARTAVPALVAEVERLRAERDTRQQIVSGWCAMSFGTGAASSLPQRALRLLEEVIEAYQATGADPAMAHKLVDFVFSRPVGELSKEIGAVGLVLLSLANAAGVSADAEEAREVARVLAKPNAHWADRNASKNAAGFDTARAALPEEPADGT